jgi:hypothetical protein
MRQDWLREELGCKVADSGNLADKTARVILDLPPCLNMTFRTESRMAAQAQSGPLSAFASPERKLTNKTRAPLQIEAHGRYGTILSRPATT